MSAGLVQAEQYTADDLLNTVRVLGPWWFCLTEDIRDPLANAVLARLITSQQRSLDALAASCEVPSQLFRLDLSGERELSLAASMLRNRTESVRPFLERCINESIQLLYEAAAEMRAVRSTRQHHRDAGVGQVGTVHGVFVSSGGVPKRSVDHIDIGQRGAAGDRQATRRHHGRPWQALCLWSEDVVTNLAAEGHPIVAGAAGENISISGVDWSGVLPGSEIRFLSADPSRADQPGVVAEVSLYALPCAKNARWFVDGDFERMHHRREHGVSRLYASVVQGGSVRPGDAVEIR